ncbi:phage tail protein [Lysinibacillus sp. 1 U-2021]|uniref:phage tail protein n=1 Tax=Lysinibacillus sp. 1 U-2021 TaxID=3039426 RepID=UPI002480D697|nr:phage tail protein [Lysinibacillus sp. 1 U-2021]WGT38005.1 phage tail protein [Lysinibacillus sp. 1 U-2021]
MAYKRSNFPDSYLELPELYDLSPSLITKAEEYKNLLIKPNKNSVEIERFNQLKVELQNYTISPEWINTLGDEITATQKYFVENTTDYIEQLKIETKSYTESKKVEFQAEVDKFNLVGNYSPTVQYYKKNMVKFNGQIYLCIKDNYNNSPLDNNDNEFWILQSKKGDKGDQGVAGVGLTFKSEYSPNITYNPDEAVQYNGSVYYCISTVVGETPSENGTSWRLFLARSGIVVSSTPPSSPIDKMVWVDSNINKFKYYNASTSSWIALNADNADKLGGKTLSQIEDDYISKITNHEAILASTTTIGHTQLNDTVTSTSKSQAATANAVKTAYDKSVSAENKVNIHIDDSTSHVRYGIASGTNAKVITITPIPTSYIDGMAIAFKNLSANTGAVTLNVNNLGAKNILDSKGTALASGKLLVNSIYTVRYNGANFILQGEGGDASTGDEISKFKTVIKNTVTSPTFSNDSITSMVYNKDREEVYITYNLSSSGNYLVTFDANTLARKTLINLGSYMATRIMFDEANIYFSQGSSASNNNLKRVAHGTTAPINTVFTSTNNYDGSYWLEGDKIVVCISNTIRLVNKSDLSNIWTTPVNFARCVCITDGFVYAATIQNEVWGITKFNMLDGAVISHFPLIYVIPNVIIPFKNTLTLRGIKMGGGSLDITHISTMSKSSGIEYAVEQVVSNLKSETPNSGGWVYITGRFVSYDNKLQSGYGDSVFVAGDETKLFVVDALNRSVIKRFDIVAVVT